MPDQFLSIRNVSKVYKGKNPVRALNNVSLEIHKGEVFGLLGANGAGKTTLSSIIATLHPPTAGDVLFKGKSIYTDVAMYRRSLGLCPQTQNLDGELTVEENLLFAGRYFLMPEDTIVQRAEELMAMLDLKKYANFSVHALSGGNKQRVLIARALMHNPEIVLLDEPTVGLDPDIRRTLWGIIKDLKKMGITVVLTTHYLDEAQELSDRICMLHKGTVRLVESVQALREQRGMRNLEEIFIELTQEYETE